jgi:PAS domain S-box-containing protein
VGVWECDWVTKTLTWDATMFDIYGISPVARMSCDDWTTAIFPEDLPTLQATLQKVVDEKSLGRSEFRIVRPDGSVRNVSGVQGVDLDDRGNVSRLIGVNMDVTERKQAEEALEQSRMDQMRFKDEFMSHVSHELRSPLTAIKQFTTILLGGLAGELNKEQREYELIVLKNIRQLQAMIDDLLEVTRLGAGKLTAEPECISVADVVADTLDTMRVTAKAKGIMLSWNSPPELPQAYADPTRLEQILIILLDNAIKFTASGGNVRIQAKLQPQDPFLLLEVSDTGCGISAEITGKIFERLYQVSSATQSSRKGLGLGLYICKQLVTQQGGQIYVESQPGKGSTFSFTMPVFSLRSVIAPLLKDDKWPAKSAAIVMVTIELPGAWPSRESREEWCRDALVLIQRCLLPDLDVLLPKVRSGSGERFIVAAFAEQHGVSILANRIREQFERHLLLKQTGMTISVSHRMLQPFPQAVGASLEKAVADMATNLEESIKSQIISEAVYHG